jgi:hypothetical protein
VSSLRSFSFVRLSAAAAIAAALLVAAPARAQTRWDASLQAGGSGRIFSGNANVAGLPGSIGPIVGLTADVAIIPLLRVGLYGDYEYADTSEPKAPSAISFGGRLKLMLPGYRGGVHWWLFTGIGGVVWEAPGYAQLAQNPSVTTGPSNTVENVSAASGYFAEVPLGVGMGWRVHGSWELVAELQGRFGFAMNGSYFTDDGTGNGLTRPATTSNGTAAYGEPTGTDVLAIQLTVGIGFEGP